MNEEIKKEEKPIPEFNKIINNTLERIKKLGVNSISIEGLWIQIKDQFRKELKHMLETSEIFGTFENENPFKPFESILFKDHMLHNKGAYEYFEEFDSEINTINLI